MDAGEIFVERIVEPFIGMPLLGVGGYLPILDRGIRIEVRYDGQTAAVSTPATVDNYARLHFSTQLPLELNVRRVRVVAVNDRNERVLFDDDLDAIGPRR